MKIFALPLILFATAASAATPWEAYLELPSAAHAEKVEVLAYSQPMEGGYDAADLGILGLQVVAGDAAAFRLADRLARQSDGALAEDLSAILGAAVRPQPAMFLQQVKRLGRPCADFNVAVAGLEYADRPAASRYELERRVAALESVRDPDLRSVRAQCLSELRQELGTISQAAPHGPRSGPNNSSKPTPLRGAA